MNALVLLTLVVSALPPGAGELGLAGVDRVILPSSSPRADVYAGLRAAYFRADDFLLPGDFHEQQQLVLNVAWSPLPFLSLGYAHTAVVNYNSAFEPAARSIFGDPRLTLAAQTPLTEALSAGGVASVVLPTGTSRELDPGAAVVTLLGNVALETARVRLGANIGYRIDRSGELFDTPPDPAYAFASSVATTDPLLYAASVEVLALETRRATLLPLVELAGLVPLGSSEPKPLQVTAGLRVLALGDALDLALGARVRITGEPAKQVEVQGLPPVQGFVQLGFHFGRGGVGARSCDTDADCDTAQTCHQNLCATIVEKVVEKVVEKPVDRVVETKVVEEPPSFVLAGVITDSQTKQPIEGAVIAIKGSTTSAIATDAAGRFRSYALPAGEGLMAITVRAPGYHPNETAVKKGADDTVQEVAIELLADRGSIGLIKGIVQDMNGRPVKGCQATTPATRAVGRTNAQGEFQLEVKPGRHPLRIRCKGYADQVSPVLLEKPGEVVIFNADVSRR